METAHGRMLIVIRNARPWKAFVEEQGDPERQQGREDGDLNGSSGTCGPSRYQTFVAVSAIRKLARPANSKRLRRRSMSLSGEPERIEERIEVEDDQHDRQRNGEEVGEVSGAHPRAVGQAPPATGRPRFCRLRTVTCCVMTLASPLPHPSGRGRPAAVAASGAAGWATHSPSPGASAVCRHAFVLGDEPTAPPRKPWTSACVGPSSWPR